MAVPFVHFCISTTKPAKTAQKQRAIPLFSRSPNRWRLRISAGNAIAPADNFVQKQQKQQKQQNNGNYRPAAVFAYLVNAWKHYSGFQSGWGSLRRFPRRKMDVICDQRIATQQ